MASSGASRAASARNTPSAVGERQILPRQTNRILNGSLPRAVAASLQTRAHRALVIGTLRTGLIRRRAPRGLRGIKPGLGGGPLVALVLVRRLLLCRLSVLGIDEQLIALRRWRLRRLGRCALIVRRRHDLIAVLRSVPGVVSLVRVVVGEPAYPQRGVERRQKRHKTPDGSADHH